MAYIDTLTLFSQSKAFKQLSPSDRLQVDKLNEDEAKLRNRMLQLMERKKEIVDKQKQLKEERKDEIVEWRKRLDEMKVSCSQACVARKREVTQRSRVADALWNPFSPLGSQNEGIPSSHSLMMAFLSRRSPAARAAKPRVERTKSRNLALARSAARATRATTTFASGISVVCQVRC